MGSPVTGYYYRRRLPRVRVLTDIVDWGDWRRPKRSRVKLVSYRNADTGLPVTVLVPTLWGRIVCLWHQWTEVD